MFEKVGDIIASRVITPVYSTFAIISATIYWKFWVVLFFISEEGIQASYPGLSKVDYMANLLWSPEGKYGVWISVLRWILPFLFTYIFIWWFPKFVGVPAYRREQLFKVDMRLAKIEEEGRIVKKESKVLKEKEENVDLETSVIEKELNLEKTLEKEWTQEFNEFVESRHFEKFSFLQESIYTHQGRIEISDPYEGQSTFLFPEDALAYFHSNGIVELNQDTRRISITEKGKFFIRQFSQLKKLDL